MELEIIPAIQVKTLRQLQRKLNRVKELVGRVQIDIVSEEFEDNKSIELDDLARVSTSLLIEVQLMVGNPVQYLNRCDGVGVERVYGQVEQMPDQEEFVETAADLGMQVGLALDIHTPVKAIEKMLPYLDGVLLMSVEVGFSGQEFDPKVLAKIKGLRKSDFARDICVDGGLDKEAIRLCRLSGANQFAVGSALWQAENLKQKIEELRRIE